MRALAFPVMALRDKIEAFGFQDGDEFDQREIMSSVMEFGETRVREVMVPRIDIVATSVTMDRDEAISLIIEAGHSRIPVYEDTVDRIVGVLYTKDLLRESIEGTDSSLREMARPAFFVPESKRIDELLAEFRARRQHLAVVVDEYGGTAGIVTLEDVLEEIVGDIQDEFDSEEELIHRVDDDTVVCNAKVRVDELNEELGLHLPEEAAESLGGLLYHMIGQVPREGDTWTSDGVVFEIQSVEGQRIHKVSIRGLAALRPELENGAG
jgi:CBS domain containing-hemolysin-like protein